MSLDENRASHTLTASRQEKRIPEPPNHRGCVVGQLGQKPASGTCATGRSRQLRNGPEEDFLDNLRRGGLADSACCSRLLTLLVNTEIAAYLGARPSLQIFFPVVILRLCDCPLEWEVRPRLSQRSIVISAITQSRLLRLKSTGVEEPSTKIATPKRSHTL
jgi:hypothetical protein